MATYNAEAPVLDTYQAVVLAFSDFLTVAIHTILYERDVYPRASFLTARKFNYPVRQSRHPKVCKWIQDAVAAVEAEMLKVRSLTLFPCSIAQRMEFSMFCSLEPSCCFASMIPNTSELVIQR